MNKYAVVIEKGERSYGAYVPDLPGCVTVGPTKEEVERLIAEAITLHGNLVSLPSSSVEYIEPAAVA